MLLVADSYDVIALCVTMIVLCVAWAFLGRKTGPVVFQTQHESVTHEALILPKRSFVNHTVTNKNIKHSQALMEWENMHKTSIDGIDYAVVFPSN